MTLDVVVHDVGHGQAVHAFTPNGQCIVIDLGCSSEFSPLQWLRTIRQDIDLLIVTHPHGDHIDEILLLDQLGLTVNKWLVPWHLTPQEVYAQNQSSYAKKLDAYFERIWRCTPVPGGQEVGNPSVSGGVSLKSFGNAGTAPANINNHSLVTVLEYASSKIVIPGDNEVASWQALMTDVAFLQAVSGADIFMASHHGRENGYHSDLLSFIKPRLCVISDGDKQETDATPRYSYHAQGWGVRAISKGAIDTKKALTTRTNGSAYIRAGYNANELGGKTPYLQVQVP